MRGGIGCMAGFAGMIGVFAIPVPAMSARLDCAHTTTPRERLICHDSSLFDLDDQLGRAYEAKRAILSPHGHDLLRDSERDWLHFIATVCPLAAPSGTGVPWNPKQCLEGNYRERLGQLKKVGQRVGPFVFSRVDLYNAEPAPDARTGSQPGFYVEHVAYPQIDSPSTPQAVAWNKKSLKVLSKNDTDPGDYDTDYEIDYANQRVISVQWNDSYYYHGAAHGGGGFTTQNLVLWPTLRALTERDIFGTSNGWVKTLQELFWSELRKGGWKPPEDEAETVKSAIERKVIRPEYWTFTAEGLKVSFSAYEGGCYTCTPYPVTVPWADFKPLLSHDALVP